MSLSAVDLMMRRSAMTLLLCALPVLACRTQEAAVEQCLKAVNDARAEGSDVSAGTLARRCADVYASAGCQAAHRDFDRAPVEARVSTLAMACAKAYCPILGRDASKLCSEPDRLSVVALGVAFIDLRRAAWRHDLGA